MYKVDRVDNLEVVITEIPIFWIECIIFRCFQIHYALSLYNYIGRFTNGEVDLKSALFHLQKAALCGSLEANKILAYKYFQLPTDDFEDLVADVRIFIDC